MDDLSRVVDIITKMPEDRRAALVAQVMGATKGRNFIPSPGPQRAAYYSPADVLLYGGCVSGDTEYLSPDGWRRIDRYDGGEVAQVRLWPGSDNRLTRDYDFILPKRYIDAPCSSLVIVTHRIDPIDNPEVMRLSLCHEVPIFDNAKEDRYEKVYLGDLMSGDYNDHHVNFVNGMKCGSFGYDLVRIGDLRYSFAPNERMYCFETGSGLWLARYKGNIFVTGNSAGAGKSALVAGLAVQEHDRSLLVRKKYTDVVALADEVLKFYGSKRGFVKSPRPRLGMENGGLVEFGAFNNPGDEESFQGIAHDFCAFDEVTSLPKKQVLYVMTWNRPMKKGQRSRTLFASNPPTSSTGDWVIDYFRPWLDPTHDNPAKHGELRWFVSDPDGNDLEVDNGDPYLFPGAEKPVAPKSRTFIPGKLSDNPFLTGTGYDATLDSLPEPFRSAMRDGNFMLERKDQDMQMIPTAWVHAAFERWDNTNRPAGGMTHMGVDIAQGGSHDGCIARRHDWWIDKLIVTPGIKTPESGDTAALVLKYRRGEGKVVLDMGGGFGGGVKIILEDVGIDCTEYKGGNSAPRKNNTGHYGFINTRSEAYWRVREALDPEQRGGAKLALPRSPRLMSDLTAAVYSIEKSGKKLLIKMEPKEALVKRLGRCTDYGDGVALAMWQDPIDGGPINSYQAKKSIRAQKKKKVLRGHPKRRGRR